MFRAAANIIGPPGRRHVRNARDSVGFCCNAAKEVQCQERTKEDSSQLEPRGALSTSSVVRYCIGGHASAPLGGPHAVQRIVPSDPQPLGRATRPRRQPSNRSWRNKQVGSSSFAAEDIGTCGSSPSCPPRVTYPHPHKIGSSAIILKAPTLNHESYGA